MAKDADVLVVGAGIAGLIAARDLSRAGLRVELIEARTRVGGRIATLHSPDWPLPMELGAEFLHGRPEAALRLLNEHGLSLERLADVHDRRIDGRLVRENGFWANVGGVLDKRDPGRDRSAGELLRSAPLGADEADLFRLIVEGFHAAPVEDVSVESLAGDASTSGDPEDEAQQRVRGGYGALVEKLSTALDPERVAFSRGTPVRVIEWRRGAVTASVERAGRPVEIQTRCAVITASVGALHESPESGGLRFSPDIESKRPALSLIAMGHVVKAFLCFRREFWKAAPPDLEFLHDGQRPFPTFWRISSGERCMFVAWAGGPKASALADKPASYVVPLALEALCQVLSADVEAARALLVGSEAYCYSGDPFVRGAYSYVRPEGAGARQALGAPLENTLFFAGEATDTENPATVAGAIASGERAAREVLATR